MKTLAGFLGGALLAALAIVVVGSLRSTPADAAAAIRDPIERGAYIVNTAGCHDCHTPWHMGPEGPEPDMSRALSGHPQDIEITLPATLEAGHWVMAANGTNTAWSGPWGVSFTANLTPDENTGLGIWTEDMFVRALRTGRHMGQSRPILPPMPWTVYRNLTDEDLGAVYAYLRSIPPIHNRVPEPLPPPGAVAAAG